MNQFKGVEVGEHVTSFMEQTTDNPVGLAFVIWALVWIKPISIKKKWDNICYSFSLLLL